MDFTLKKYRELLMALKDRGYLFRTFAQYCQHALVPETNYVLLRHDVDLKPQNSLATAQMEARMGITATYYFRAVPESWNEDVIREIAVLGHEVGYHYESLTTCNGCMEDAYEDFCKNLKRLRQIAPVSTICMHGSPRSPYDSKEMWKAYDYHALGIVGEPYMDSDFSRLFYLTDTGRRWDGARVSVRDKIPVWQDEWERIGWSYHSTDDILDAIRNGTLPPYLMMTTHPQRWTDNKVEWMKELLLQRAKNIAKRLLVR